MVRKAGFKLNSITFRLSFLIAMSAIFLLTVTGAFLYRFLEVELMKRDHEELIGKVDLFRHQLSTVESPERIVASPKQFHDVIIGHPHLHLALIDEQGNILLKASDWEPPAKLLAQPIDINATPTHSSISMPSPAQPYHALAAWGALGDKRASRVLIALALEADDALSLLLRYKQTLLLTMVLSGLSAALIGYIIVQRGLRPLHAMAETASEISASHLQRRLNVTDTPAELKELAGAFNDMLARLHSSFDRLSDFSSDLAHELRTPINNLMGQTQVALSRTRNAEEYRTVLESNLEEHERLARMIRDMLFLAQADNSRASSVPETLNQEQLDLRAELDKIAEFYQLAADEQGVRIVTGGSGSIMAERILVQRAIGNLISNALQHSPPNSTVQAIVTSAEKAVDLQVSNHGASIPVEHLEKIFDRFYRVNNARSHTDTGSGLGLAIVKSIMELHGGRVSVTSKANQLTTFTLHFPTTSPADTASIAR